MPVLNFVRFLKFDLMNKVMKKNIIHEIKVFLFWKFPDTITKTTAAKTQNLCIPVKFCEIYW